MNTDVSYIAVVAVGELPLQPQLTPGWGVAGAIMLLTGATFTIIGIKNGWLLTFFSSAFLTSLCIAILIVYVMSPPIRDAVQGGYVVAVVIAGLVLGGAATLFRELTEGFGCLLGGFCVSMWLLTLKEGGVLTETTQKIIFIAAFTVGGYAFYFSHYTRGYAQIGLTSFSGATVTVLGIDCFTKAGLKEYWAYIWNLNKNLFPLNTTTYPLTKVIRVETALIIIFTALGIISQLKLWRVIQEHRATRAEELAEEQRQRDAEEANVGQQVEEENEREKRQWEATYGDKQPKTSIGSGSGDSGVGDMENEKKARYSEVTTVPVPAGASTDGENEIEMQDLPASSSNSPSMPPKQGSDGLVVPDQHEDVGGRVTVRVASDDGPTTTLDESLQPMPEPEEKVWIARADGEARPASLASARNSRRLSKPASPEIVPLPFRVPQFEELAERDPADRSSFATIADEDEHPIIVNKRLSRASAGNRLSALSAGSGKIMRSLSGRSQRSQTSKRKSGGGFASRPESPPHRDSSEGLVAETRDSISADSASVAATIDGLSDDDTDKSGGVDVEGRGRSIEILAELAERHAAVESNTEGQKIAEKPESEPAEAHRVPGKENPNLAVTNEPTGTQSKRSSSANTPAKTTASNAEATEPTEEPTESAKNPRSAAPSVASSRASLTKDRLPSGLSRVALSYRTNEWAKHLSQAEIPEPEKLQLNEHHPEQEVAVENREEPAVPVNVEELQQTAETSSVPPAPPATMPRSSSSASKAAVAAAPQASEPVYRSSSRATVNPKNASPPSQPALLTASPNQIAIAFANANGGGGPVSPISPLPPPTGGLQASHSFRMKAGGNSRRTSTDVIALPIAEETGDERYAMSAAAAAAAAQPEDTTEQQQQQPVPSSRPPVPGVVPYASPQTLLGQREMLLRNKSQPMLVTPPIPEYPEHEYHSGSSSEAGSIYNYRSSSMPMPMPGPVTDIDDIPLSQRKELMMRQNSMLSLTGGGGGGGGGSNRPNSTAMAMHQYHHNNHIPRATPTPTPQRNAEKLPFNSHQPLRRSTAPTPTQRESQLASFRNSVAMDLRAGTAINIPGNGSNLNLNTTSGGGGGGGRETPLFPGSSANNLMMMQSAGSAGAVATAKERDGEVRRSIDRSRNALLSQKEQEAQRRELEQWEKERSQRAFEEMMRSGNLMDAHREAMRKMQGGVRDR